jgi:hypothetical protein
VLWWEEDTHYSSYRTVDANIPGGKMDRRETHSWHILGSYPTNVACERQQEWKIGAMLKTWRKDKAEAKFAEHTISHQSGSNIISRNSEYVNENTSSFLTRYLCLPDTVDPRGPKGDGR